MTADPQLTPVQRDLVNLLHEIGGVEKQETAHLGRAVRVVRLIVVGDGGRPVEVLVDEFGQVEWKIAGERL